MAGGSQVLAGLLSISLVLVTSQAYLVIIPDTAPPGSTVIDAAVYKLGSERTYTIDVHRTANFVHHVLKVNRTSGLVTLKKRLKCDGVFYPNLFTFYVDSTSDRIRDINYYSLPIRVLVTGADCSRKHADLYDIDFDRAYDQDDSAVQYEDDHHFRDKRDVTFQEDIDWRLLEEDELNTSQYSVLSTAYPWHNAYMEESIVDKYRIRKKRSHYNIPFDMSVEVKIAEAKQWISETYASFAIPTTDKWQGICLKSSQFVNSLKAFLPKTVQKHCKVQFLDVNDPRFLIENSQGDLVASEDLCILEPMWKVSVLFTFNCEDTNIVDSDHRLKIVYHHQELNDTDIAKRVKRELRNQSPYFEQALYVASVAEEQDPGVVVTTVRARDPENSPVTYSMSSLLDSRSSGMFSVDSRTGVVTTQARLDRERLDVHYFRVVAQDDTFPPRTGTTTLQINVIDCNDHAPIFEMQQYEASVREGASPGTTILTLKATDQDVGKNAEVEYSIDSITAITPDNNSSTLEQPDRQQFHVDSRSGAFITRGSLDRESVARFTVVVRATDQTNPASERMYSTATVHVTVLDDNDNYPQFSEKTYTVSVDEDISVADSPVIATIKATDADIGPNAAVRYAIIGGNTQMQFSIDSLSGDVSLVKPLDYEQLKSYRLVIRAQDGGSPSRSNTTQLLVNVKDVNDNVPRFYTSLFQETVSENVPVGFSIVRVQAYDADEGVNAEITYTLSESELHSGRELPISIDSRSGWVYTTRQLDREEQSKYQLQVTATDGGSPPRSATASVAVSVQDVNDNDPVFTPPAYDVELAEDETPGTPVVTVTATDADEDNRLHYEITGGNTRGRFSITSQNGRGLVTVAQPLDFKQERRYVLTVTATDSGGRTDTALVNINITDANNYAPVFENAPYTASVFEDAPIGTTVLVVSATDSDVSINAQITYSLSSEIASEAGTHQHEFVINPHTGAITTNKVLDREVMSGYLLTVTARDGGSPPLSDTTDIEISVVDVNDNPPHFDLPLYTATIAEDALIGTSVVQISASDSDTGLNGRVVYSLSEADREDGSFVVDPTSGVIRSDKPLDRESVAVYDLTARATDMGTPAMSSTVTVHIKVEDINDSPPVFESDTLTLYVAENSPIGTTIGEIYARDPDEGQNAQVHYSIKGGEDSNSFSLVTHQGSDRAHLVSMIDLDYESPRKKYELIIRASSPPLWNDVRVEILVTDVNDNAPMLKDFQVIFNNYKDCFPVGPFGKVPAFDADVSDKLIYRILSGNNANLVLLNETTGAMTLSPQLNTNVPKLATMEISVTDGVNEIKAVMQLSVRLITEEMLHNSITVRLNDMTAERFLSPLFGYFVDGLAAIIPCPRENIYVFSVQDDTDITGSVLNVSFSARRPTAEVTSHNSADVTSHSTYYSTTHLKERVYLHRATLVKLATVQVLPFDDNVCVHEPCLNFESCVTVLRFGNATGFVASDTVLFRPIYPTTTFSCQCPNGFTGSVEHYLCDTEVDLCYSSPCHNQAKCVSTENSYTCLCKPGFTGRDCSQKSVNTTCPDVCTSGCSGSSCGMTSRSFPKDAFLTLPGIKARHRFHIQLRFATQSSSGLLLYNGRYNERHDFIALELISSGAGDISTSGVKFTFSLGGAATEVSVGGRLDDGEWHSVAVKYFNRTATLIVDNCDVRLALAGAGKLDTKFACANRTTKVLPPRCDEPTETCHRFLDLTGPLQIGGLPNIPSSFQVKNKDYIGCIADLKIDEKLIDLNSYVADVGTISGCPEKRSHCSSEPCYNGGTCTELWNTFLCECTQGFTGKDCGEPTTPPWRFSGDGLLSFNPLLRPIQVPWLNALSLRTRLQDTFLMSIQIGQNSTVLLTLKSGYLHYTYNGEVLMRSEVTLNDGEWHRVEVTWLGTELHLDLEYGARRSTHGIVGYKSLATLLTKINTQYLAYRHSMQLEVQGQYVGRILIGGDDAAAGLLATELGYFDGCIQDVRVGNSQSLLNRPTVRENVREGCQSRADCMLSMCPPHSVCVSGWDVTVCECEGGRGGPSCVSLCEVAPCPGGATCVPHTHLHTVSCTCPEGYTLTDRGCAVIGSRVCPAGWWGRGGTCGPCSCRGDRGEHPHCDQDSGKCRCKDNHYWSDGGCAPCGCYPGGSVNGSCGGGGQCPCHPGVGGRRCLSCASLYAEVAHQGCQVVYDGCPKSFSNDVWWPRTKFSEQAITDCPTGTVGKASRMCDKSQVIPWQEPDMFNCTTQSFYQLKKQLDKLESGELTLNTFVSVRLGEELWLAVRGSDMLYGGDVTVATGLIRHMLQYELAQEGLNLTHTQHSQYITNLLKSTNAIINIRYEQEWRRIRELTGDGTEQLVELFDKYITVLAQSQRDTYTSPFEIVQTDIVLGVDIVTAESIYGFEPTQLNQNFFEPFTTERVVLPDTSSFIHSPLTSNSYFSTGKKAKRASSPTVSFPKYNNYVKSKNKFDQHSRVLLPLDLIGISSTHIQDPTDLQFESRAVFSYTQFSYNSSQLLPLRFDDSVEKRWGVNISVGGTVMQIAVFVPEHVWKMHTDNSIEGEDATGISYANRGNHNQNQINNQIRNPNSKWPTNEVENHEPIIIQPAPKTKEENNLPEAQALKIESRKSMNSTKEVAKMAYKSLSGLRLKRPVRLQLLLNVNRESFGSRTNPQCVHWSTVRGFGEWSRVGCHTEIDYDWSPYSEDPLLVNCTCYHLSTFTVLVDEVDIEYIPEPSFLESVSSYTAFSISIPLLLITWISLCLIRGGQATVSNSIHKHLLFSVMMAELLLFIAMKTRHVMVHNEPVCRMWALSLQYWWVCAVSWACISSWQVRRLVREVRDVNHAPLTPLLAVGYALPALLLALALSHHQRQFGNALFCWVSVHEPAVWWQVGPIVVLSLAAGALLVSATSAAFTLRDHVTGYGNLRVVLGVNIVLLPLLLAVWSTGLVTSSERGPGRPGWAVSLCVSTLTHALVALVGHLVLNHRVRHHLHGTILKCMGKKVPLADTSVIISTSAHNLSGINRSSLAYHSGTEGGRTLRNIGLTASSTTSRSTTKTSSSPYSRSDGQLRHTSTSTSNYNTSNSDMPAYLRGFDSSLHTKRDAGGRRRVKPCSTSEVSDSESEGHRHSLDLASSHSSDDDETNTRTTTSIRERSVKNSSNNCLPNITEGAPLSLNPRWQTQREESICASPPIPGPDVTRAGVTSLPALLTDVHDSYLHNVHHTPIQEHRYGPIGEEFSYAMTSQETDKPITYDPNYPISPTMYRIPHYGSKTYIPSRNSDYSPQTIGYSPTKYLNDVYGSNEFNHREFRDSGIATLLKKDYQRRLESQYGDYDGMSDVGSEKIGHDKYLFPYTAEEDHVSLRAVARSPQVHNAALNNTGEVQQHMAAPLASMGETSEKSTIEDDDETRV